MSYDYMSNYFPYYFPYYFSEYIHVDFYIHKSVLACLTGIIIGNGIVYLVRIYSGEIKFNDKKNLPC
jgi:hypothetical protein